MILRTSHERSWPLCFDSMSICSGAASWFTQTWLVLCPPSCLRNCLTRWPGQTKIIQETLAECGWPDAKELEQQDTSEAFAFITETLQLPLLQLQVDLFHHGKKDQDDHKIVQERLLNLAVPPDPEGKGLRLEDCLEEYFNTKVDVLRDSHDEKMDGRRPAASRLNTIRMVTREDDPDSPVTLTASPIQASPILQKATENGLNGEAEEKEEQAEHVETNPAGPSRPSPRHRSTSVIQHVVVDEESTKNVTESNTTLLERARRTSSTVVKAVTIPAWQFFRLIPWHTTSNNAPQNDHDVAMNLGQRPVVGICLKRYGLNAQNYPMRLNTYIDIPDSLKLPHFMLADDTHLEEDPNGFSTEYKLVLQSVVCHRGDSVYSGHYIAFSRVAPKLLKDNRKHDFDPPPDYEEPQWVKFDDLEYGNRVTYVEDLKKALKEEMPYLLFYQIVPVVDMASTEEADTEVEPPSYADSKTSVANSTAASLSDSGLLSSAHADDSDYFENGGASPPRERTIRFSSEIERPPRLSFDDTTDDDEIRRGRQTPARTPDTASPAVTPGTTPGDESTRDRFSRAAALFSNKSRSRPGSQAGEGRMSLTMNRLGGLIRTSKEPLRDPNSIAATVSAPPAPQGPPSGQVSARQSVDVPRPSFESESRLDLKEGKSEHLTPRKHHTHRRSKSKHKGEQPERECNLM